ncbi:MAG: dihydrolipoamide acetyltransferase family protein, partial [Anaerolineae bacterium]
MPFEIVMPSLGQTTNEVEIIKWLKKEGEPVQQGEPLLEVMTDKANVEVESWASGVLRRILFGEGQKVPSGEVIAIVTAAGEEWSEAMEVAAPRAEAPAPLAERPQAVVKGRPGRVRASPLARKIAAEKGIDLATVTGTGPGGVVTKEDVLRIAAPTAPAAAVRPEEAPLGRLVPLTSMRRAIGRRMVESKTTIPHFYVGLEVDMSEAVKLRQTLNPQLERRGQAAISPTDILIAAAATTLIEFPQVNVRLEEEGIRWIDDVNIGLAVALE